MPTTTNYGWTTPADTDLVKDGASAIRTLGTAIDTTVYNNAQAAIAKTIVDAKGDIIAATAADTVARLAVGSNDTVLTADSSTATGLKWATPAAGGMTLISTTTLTGASITLSSIPQTYNDLRLVIRSYRPATDSAWLYAQINADSTANRHTDTVTSYSDVDGATARSFGSDANLIGGQQDNGTSNALTIVDYYDYTNTATWRLGFTWSTGNNGTTTTSTNLMLRVLSYNQTNAITSLKLFPSSGNFTSGTCLLYGVK